MIRKNHLRWASLLALTLTGCATRIPAPLGMPAPDRVGTAGVQTTQQASRNGSLFFVIRWAAPSGYSAQAIPADAKLLITVKSKAGAVLAAQSQERPTNGTTSTATFEVDPAEGRVDLEVLAKRGDQVIMTGGAKDVPVRPNTATGVTISLADVVTTEDPEQIKVRVDEQVALVKNLKDYATRYDHFLKYAESAEAKNLVDAFDKVMTYFKNMPSTSQLPVAEPTSAAFDESAKVTVTNPGVPGFIVELDGPALRSIAWPGYKVTLTDPSPTGNQRTFKADLTASGEPGDGSTGELQATVTANDWINSPFLRTTMTLPKDESTTGTRSVTVMGGQIPATGSVSALSLGGKFTPRGVATDSVSFSLLADQYTKPANSLLLQQMFPTVVPPGSGGSPTPFNPLDHLLSPAGGLPTHLNAVVSLPSVAATADIQVLSPDFMTWSVGGDIKLKDNAGNFNTYKVALGVKLQATRYSSGYGSTYVSLTPNEITLSVSDMEAQLAMHGSVGLAAGNPVPVVTAWFEDIPTKTRIATLKMPINVETSRLSGWPTLELKDGDKITLTPGYFTGESTGSVSIYVR